jgi:hypothetical protein
LSKLNSFFLILLPTDQPKNIRGLMKVFFLDEGLFLVNA